MEKKAEARRTLFSRLNQAVADQQTAEVRALLLEAKTATKADRTEEEETAVRAATDYLAAAVPAATKRLDALLEDISRIPANTDPRLLKPKVQQLFEEASAIGKLGEHRQARLELWSERLLYMPFPPRTPTPLKARESASPHEVAGRGYWTTRPCPCCKADRGQKCVINDGSRAGQVRQVPHADRLRPIIEELKEQQENQRGEIRTVWQVYDVTCPVCRQEAGTWCLTPGRPHQPRSKPAAEFTRRQELRR
ncbi:hypothetical protein [Streptomyces sp. NPDC052042]|uniref:hypothetical protein n=1 Tax=Streptomyces sp. NPDC052042 TaxID=3365683 RepID=UPI0037D51FE4